MTYYVGVSGWRYRAWRGDFYPQGLVQRRELEYVAQRMTSAEINGSFYSLQRPSSYATWHDETPDDFVFAVKGGRFITHMKKLRDVETPLANFFASGVLALGRKLGPVLWQLPARTTFDPGRVGDFLAMLPRTLDETARLARGHDDKLAEGRALVDLPDGLDGRRRVRHALEPRHPSFDTDEARELLRAHDVAMVVADSAGRWPRMEDSTTDLHYVRLHGETELYTSAYPPSSLDRWAELCREWHDQGGDVHVYLDNDARGHAPHDAVSLLDRLGGVPEHRTPVPGGPGEQGGG
ncbi:DUF72 domain-containing protein [Janibacter sp. Y6]|uniref:DUF72 domain-containing protein n=1 Tax=Janibacter sp. Y6 TaxID=2913552 RepID=UPI0034A10464